MQSKNAEGIYIYTKIREQLIENKEYITIKLCIINRHVYLRLYAFVDKNAINYRRQTSVINISGLSNV